MSRRLVLVYLAAISAGALAESVTVDTFVRAETDVAIKKVYEQVGFGQVHHFRALTPLDQQMVIRMNRDTLYSTAVIDLSKPVTVSLPETDGRYMSLQVINQDHFSYAISTPGHQKLSQDKVGSRFGYLIFRTFIDGNDKGDIAAANALQDKIKISGGSKGPLEVPDWDNEQLLRARGALNTLAAMGMDAATAFGTREETDPIDHLIGAAAGWGGLPQQNAYYQLRSVSDNDGTPHSVTVKDVPVNAFWSMTVYNADGFIDENDRGAYSFNGVTAARNADGSVTIHFGGCEDGRVNCLPVSPGWNYSARMYEPRPEILSGDWVFPEPVPID